LIIEDLAKEEKLDMMPGAFLHELWKYHQRVRSNLASDLQEFKRSDTTPAILGDSSCGILKISGFSGLPPWVDYYISDIGRNCVPASLDLTDFLMELAEHLEDQSSNGGCESCSGIPRNRIREFWRALTATISGSIAKVSVAYIFA
jgi:hypothetical protein